MESMSYLVNNTTETDIVAQIIKDDFEGILKALNAKKTEIVSNAI